MYEEALTHSSMLDGDKSGLKSNERLEFLGDVVLDMTMANYLYKAFPEAQEGELTKRKSRIVNRKNLNLLGKNMGLHHLIHAKMRREDIHDSMVGNALEALIGALYLDHGFMKTQRAVLVMLKHYGLDAQVNETHDFKSKLHQWATKRKKKLAFEVLKDDDTAGEERYEIAAKSTAKSTALASVARKNWQNGKRRGGRGRKSMTGAMSRVETVAAMQVIFQSAKSSSRRSGGTKGSNRKLQTKKLSHVALEWEYVPDYELLGISSSVGCHRLAWAMNRAFDWQMRADMDVVVDHGNGKTSVHPAMRHVEEGRGVHHVGLGQTSRGHLGERRLPWIFGHGEPSRTCCTRDRASLRGLDEVSFVIALDPEECGAMEPLTCFD